MTDGELLLVTGPPAVGKMSVGRAVCDRSDFRLFHNHHTIEPLLEIFGHGTTPFNVLNSEFRRRVIEEAARAGTRRVFASPSSSCTPTSRPAWSGTPARPGWTRRGPSATWPGPRPTSASWTRPTS